MATAVAPPLPSKGSFTSPSVDPLYSQALAQAQAALQAQTQPLQGQIAGNDAQTSANQTAALANAQAVAKLLSSIAPMISGVYSNAARDQGVLGKGFSTDMQHAVDASGDNVNAMLAKINAPSGQMIDPSKAANAADVLYGLGGYIPGKSFAEQGAAYAGAAAMLPAEAIAQGAQNSQQAFNAGQAIDATLNAKIAELAGKLPGDAETNYQHLQTLALDNAKFAEELRHNNVSEAQAAKRISISQDNSRVSAYYKGVTASQGAQRIKIDAARFAQTTMNQNRTYALNLAKFGVTQRAAQLKALADEFKLQNGGFSVNALNGFHATLQSLQNGIKTTTDANGTTHYFVAANSAEASKGKATKEIGYTQFVAQAIAKKVPLSLALDRANTIFPETQRPTPQELAPLLGISTQAASIGSQFGAASQDNALTTGRILGTSQKNGADITYSVPSNLSSKDKQTITGVLGLASEYLGTPYAWGGESPTGFDCSGLAQYVYAKEGVQIPRTTYEQFQTGLNVPRGQLQAGDLVFFKGSDSRVVAGRLLPGHVGIYIGGGKIIQAPHTGSVVQVSSLNSVGGYMGARRYVASGK